MDLIWVCRLGKCFFGWDWTGQITVESIEQIRLYAPTPHPCAEAKSSAPELWSAFFHKRAPSLAKILRVHAGDADPLDRVHITLVGIL
jgi:hypothetical protein